MERDKLLNYILRATQCLFSIIAFSVVVVYAGDSKIDYVLFTGISSMVITLAFILVYMLDWEDNSLMRTTELIINLLWWVFWLAAAIVTSTINDDGRRQASCAFSWMTWIVWSVSFVQSFVARKPSKTAG